MVAPPWSGAPVGGRRSLRALARRLAPRSDSAMRFLVLLLLVWSCDARDYEPYMFAAVPLHAPLPVLRVLSPAPLPVQSPRFAKPRPYATSVQHTSFTRPFVERPYAEPATYAESRPYSDTRPYESRPYADSRPYLDSRPFAESRPYSDARPYVESQRYGSRPFLESQYEPTASLGAKRARRPPPAELAVEWDGFAVPVDGASLGSEEASAELPVLYARPSPSGGYTYRKLPPKGPPKKVPAREPVLVKIHKHKIIKS